MNQNILSALHFAGDLLSNPENRCIGTLAEDRQGNPVSPQDPTACKWCLTGALGKACHELGLKQVSEQVTVYSTAKDKIGIPSDIAAPMFWDFSESLHDLMVSRLRKA